MSITDVILAREAEIDRLKVKNRNLKRALDAKQSKIDALMFEFCPGEMSAKQRANWAKHQAPVAQSEERLNSNEGVAGSSPAGSALK